MKPWIAVCAVAVLSGCGTVKTMNDEQGAADNLARWQSKCSSIPRVYSGVAYQFCNLNSPPRSGPHWATTPILLDMAVSGVADTIVLPYTGYQQYQQGNITVRRKSY